MSKVIDSLAQADVLRSNYTQAFQRREAETFLEPIVPVKVKTAYRSFPLVSYLILGGVAFLALAGVAFSIQALAQARQGNTQALQLSSAVQGYEEKLKSLEGNIVQWQAQHKKGLKDIREDLTVFDKTLNRQDRKINELSGEQNILRSTVEDLKEVNGRLTEKYIDLNSQIKDLEKSEGSQRSFGPRGPQDELLDVKNSLRAQIPPTNP